jgi:hypothetical protein
MKISLRALVVRPATSLLALAPLVLLIAACEPSPAAVTSARSRATEREKQTAIHLLEAEHDVLAPSAAAPSATRASDTGALSLSDKDAK